MSYVTAEEYTQTYKGTLIPEELLEQKLEIASLDIDALTFNRIVRDEFTNLTEYQQKMVKQAVCSHADFIFQYGDYLNLPISGFSAGSTSLSFQQGNISGQNGITTSREVMSSLRGTNLTSRLFV